MQKYEVYNLCSNYAINYNNYGGSSSSWLRNDTRDVSNSIVWNKSHELTVSSEIIFGLIFPLWVPLGRQSVLSRCTEKYIRSPFSRGTIVIWIQEGNFKFRVIDWGAVFYGTYVASLYKTSKCASILWHVLHRADLKVFFLRMNS